MDRLDWVRLTKPELIEALYGSAELETIYLQTDEKKKKDIQFTVREKNKHGLNTQTGNHCILQTNANTFFFFFFLEKTFRIVPTT